MHKWFNTSTKMVLGAFLALAMVTSVVPASLADEGESTSEDLLDDQIYPGGSCQMSAFMQGSAAATYNSLTSRIDGHGMAPTSLTGLYPDGLMYLRDGAAQVLAMLEAGDHEKAMPLVRYILQYSRASNFDGGSRLPHRAPAIQNQATKSRTGVGSVAFASNIEDILIGTIPTKDLGSGKQKQLTRIELPLKYTAGSLNSLTVRIFAGPEDPMQIKTVAATVEGNTKWISFDLPPPGYGAGNAPEELLVVVTPTDVTRDAIDVAVDSFNAARAPEPEPEPEPEPQPEPEPEPIGDLLWMGPEDEKPGFKAFTDANGFLITGGNGNTEYAPTSGLSWNEMDENMHVFYAWAQYVLVSGDKEFLVDTWPAVSKYMEYYLGTKSWWLNSNLNSSNNLLQNPRLDALSYQDGVYDLVTNVFASAVFESFHKISVTPAFSGTVNASSEAGPSWDALNKAINAGINANLVQKVNGKNVYIPWLRTKNQPDISSGAIWVSLVPNAITWNGFDKNVMRNTLDRYHEENSFNFGGVKMLNARYSTTAKPTGGTRQIYTGQWVLLKSLSWEYKFESSINNEKRLKEIALWVGNYFPGQKIPAPESWIVDYPAEVPVRDGGNQEHSSWYISSLLKTYPDCATKIVDQAKSYERPPRDGIFTPITHERFYGKDRTLTSTQAALGVYAGKKPDSVYLARGDNFVDAISGGALNDGPIILLAGQGVLNNEIKSTLKTLKPKRVVALGGTGVISNAVLDQAAKAGGSKKLRLSGKDRFGTAAAIATESFAQAKKQGKPHTTIYLADGYGPNGAGSPDAVSGGGLTDGATVLINPNSKTLPAATKTLISQLKPDKVIALGGAAVVSNAVLNDAKKAAGSGAQTDRLSGKDRYETSVAISKQAARYHAREVILVRGDELADSVTAGGMGRGPILLTQSKAAPHGVVKEIKRLRPWNINVLGGATVLNDSVVQELALEAVKPG